MGDSEPRQKLDALLAAFGKETGAVGLATEENGVCILVFDGRTHINLLADPGTDHLVVWSNLGSMPADKTEATLTSLMRANLFWNGTEGATLGLMPESNDVVLAIRRPMEGIDVAALSGLIELMIERAEAIAPVVAGSSPPPQAETPAGGVHFAAIRG